MRKSILLSVLFVFTAWSVGVSQELEKLFDSESPISMKMSFSIKEIKSKTNDSTYMDSEISVQTSSGTWQTFPFEIRTRGNFRLENCFYPPMRIKLKKDEAKGTIFQGNRLTVESVLFEAASGSPHHDALLPRFRTLL